MKDGKVVLLEPRTARPREKRVKGAVERQVDDAVELREVLLPAQGFQSRTLSSGC